MRLIGAFLLCGLVLAGCAKNPATGKMNFVLVSEDDIVETGKKTAQFHIKDKGLYKEKKELYRYYKDLGKELHKVSEISDKDNEFIILDDGAFNAWASPGYINVYRGILPYLNSESELVSLMSHEMGHLTARHSVRAETARRLTGALLVVAAAAIDSDNPTLTNTAILGASVAANAGFAKYSRVNEDEADKLALRYMEAMGYDPREAAGLYQTMEIRRAYTDDLYKYANYGKEPEKSPFYDLFDSHPDPVDRFNKVLARAGELSSQEGLSGRARYLRMVDGVAFGPNFRRYGMAGKRAIYLPKKRTKVALPEGYIIRHDGENWRAYNAESDTHFSLYTHTIKADEYAEEAMRSLYPDVTHLEEVNVGGLDAVTGVLDIKEKRGFVSKPISRVRVFGIKGGESIDAENSKRNFMVLQYYVTKKREKTSEEPSFEHVENVFKTYDPTFLEAVKGFKVLTKAQADAVEPLRVKVHTVKPGDTIASLAKQLPVNILHEAFLRALNGMYPADTLKVGQKVKLIVDVNRL